MDESLQLPPAGLGAEEATDSYSRTVITVAQAVAPHVAAIGMTGPGHEGRVRIGAGSAIVFTEDGCMLTNSHVVAGASAGQAAFADGTGTEIEIRGADVLSDLAVIRGLSHMHDPAQLGDAESLRVGQVGRSLPTALGRTRRAIEDVIQSDAVLKPGNSGGALADSRGRIVGINMAVAGAGLGLAVPINPTTRRIISALMADGRVRRAYLGLVSSPIALNEMPAMRTGQREGLRVADVMAGSPAAKAGLKPGPATWCSRSASVLSPAPRACKSSCSPRPSGCRCR